MAEPMIVNDKAATSSGADRRPTIDDMYGMPRDGQKYELVEGELKVAPAGMYHEFVAGELYFRLRLYVRDHPIGSLFTSSAGFVLDNGQVLSPDVSFVAAQKLQGPIPTGFGHFSPDLAIEIVSPGDILSDVEDKAQIYLENGTRLVWAIVPRSKRALIYRANRKLQVVEGDEPLDGEDVLPGFSCPLSAVLG